MEWKQIPDFPGYSVSDQGQVRNDATERILALQRNQKGVMNVGLMRDGVQHKRSVVVLVAHAFLPEPEPPTFDTPIHLDGDTSNNTVGNLMWRPRWFAQKYQKQFRNRPAVDRPIQEVETGYRFPTSMHAAVRYGLLDNDILESMIHHTHVWPTYQRFHVVQEG